MSMTVRQLMDELGKANPDKDVWISIPTCKTIHIIKDVASTHTDAIEGAAVIECEKLTKVQGDYVV